MNEKNQPLHINCKLELTRQSEFVTNVYEKVTLESKDYDAAIDLALATGNKDLFMHFTNKKRELQNMEAEARRLLLS